MFCKNCGKEIKDSIKYCNFCGNEVGGQNTTPKNRNDFYKKISDFFLPLGKEKKWLISTMLLLLLNPLLSMCGNYKISENVTGNNIYSETASVFRDILLMLAEEISFVSFLIFVGILAIIFAEFYMLLPLIKKSEYKSKYIIPTKIISIIAFLFIMFINVTTLGRSDAYVKCTLTFWGWLLNIDSIVLIIISFKFSSIIKKQNKNKEQEKQ